MTAPDLDQVDELHAAVGFRITRLRRAHGLRQEDLAKAVGVTRSSIANTETGRQRLPLDKYLAVAQALGVGLVDLIDIDREMPILAKPLPPGVAGPLADALEQIKQTQAVLGRLADAGVTLDRLADALAALVADGGAS